MTTKTYRDLLLDQEKNQDLIKMINFAHMADKYTNQNSYQNILSIFNQRMCMSQRQDNGSIDLDFQHFADGIPEEILDILFFLEEYIDEDKSNITEMQKNPGDLCVEKVEFLRLISKYKFNGNNELSKKMKDFVELKFYNDCNINSFQEGGYNNEDDNWKDHSNIKLRPDIFKLPSSEINIIPTQNFTSDSDVMPIKTFPLSDQEKVNLESMFKNYPTVFNLKTEKQCNDRLQYECGKIETVMENINLHFFGEQSRLKKFDFKNVKDSFEKNIKITQVEGNCAISEESYKSFKVNVINIDLTDLIKIELDLEVKKMRKKRNTP